MGSHSLLQGIFATQKSNPGIAKELVKMSYERSHQLLTHSVEGPDVGWQPYQPTNSVLNSPSSFLSATIGAQRST